MRVGLDLDGVMYPFGLAYWQACRATGRPTPGRYDLERTWDFYRGWGHSDSDFVENCHQFADAGVLWGLDPYPGAVAAVQKIADAGHEVHVITDRSFGSPAGAQSHAATLAWLARHRIPATSVTFSADKATVRTDVMIDDRVVNYDALEAAGTRAVLMSRLYNEDPACVRTRVSTVDEFADLVLAL